MVDKNLDKRDKVSFAIMILVLCSCVAILLIVANKFFSFDADKFLTVFVLSITIVSSIIGILWYLRAEITSKVLFTSSDQFAENIQDSDQSNEEQINLSNRLSDIENKLSELYFSPQDISESQKSELVQTVRQSIVATANNEFLTEIRKSIQDSKSGQEFAKDIRLIFQRTIDRLDNEVESLARRGNLNLALGILTALSGILLLAFFVLNPGGPNESPMEFVQNFLPRISLVIIVEVFAYFFLRLYSNSLIEIKHFQNELTNVEAKFLSLITATHIKSENNMTDVITQLSQTERNYILQKGQTTVNLERSKMEKETISNLAKNFIKVISRRT